MSQYQTFETQVISRKDIKNADYNPRLMDKDAQRRLKRGIKEHGLVQPVVWNRRTGNLVGGHQRLKQLDALERNEDYSLTVSVIDVSPREEAEVNVQLNNPSMQGSWDFDKLADMSEDFDLSFDDMGFSDMDVDLLFDGDDRFSKLYDTPDVEEAKGKLQEVKESRAEGAERLKERNGINWFAVIVFKDEDEKRRFYQQISMPIAEQYITVEQLSRRDRTQTR